MRNNEIIKDKMSPKHKKMSFVPKTAIGVSTFRKLVEESTVFVDKSMLIKEFLDDAAETALITYPRRWGKTINMDTIKTFLELETDREGVELPEAQKKNRALFETGKLVNGEYSALDIWQEEELVAEHFGKYPVISISLKGTRGINYEETKLAIIAEIGALFENYEYLLQSSELSSVDKQNIKDYINREADIALLKLSLKNLSKYLQAHFGKRCFILIDEYDTPINYANLRFKNVEEANSAVELFRGILGHALKENNYIKKGLVTGILRIAKADLFSGINNFQEYGLLHIKYAPYYGFVEEEVGALLKQHNIQDSTKLQIQEWYNGYNIEGLQVYNPWSVLCCLKTFIEYRASGNDFDQTKFLRSYWEESGNIEFISNLFKLPEIKELIDQLIEGDSVYFNLRRQITINDFNLLKELLNLGSNYKITNEAVELLLSYIFFAGYLTPTDSGKHFRLPNNEIKHEMSLKMLNYYNRVYNVSSKYFDLVTDRVQLLLDNSDSSITPDLMNNFKNQTQELIGNFPEFKKINKSDLSSSNSTTSTSPQIHLNEDIIHSIFSYIILQVKTASILANEYYMGKGRADLVLIDKKNKKAAVMEFKYNKSAGDALAQIEAQDYAKDLREKFTVFLIGINITPSAEVEVEYKILERGT